MEYRPNAAADEFMVQLHRFIDANQPPDMIVTTRWEQAEEEPQVVEDEPQVVEDEPQVVEDEPQVADDSENQNDDAYMYLNGRLEL